MRRATGAKEEVIFITKTADEQERGQSSDKDPNESVISSPGKLENEWRLQQRRRPPARTHTRDLMDNHCGLSHTLWTADASRVAPKPGGESNVSLAFQAASDTQAVRPARGAQGRVGEGEQGRERTKAKHVAKKTGPKSILHPPAEGLSVGFFERSLARARPSSAPPVLPEE